MSKSIPKYTPYASVETKRLRLYCPNTLSRTYLTALPSLCTSMSGAGGGQPSTRYLKEIVGFYPCPVASSPLFGLQLPQTVPSTADGSVRSRQQFRGPRVAKSCLDYYLPSISYGTVVGMSRPAAQGASRLQAITCLPRRHIRKMHHHRWRVVSVLDEYVGTIPSDTITFANNNHRDSAG